MFPTTPLEVSYKKVSSTNFVGFVHGAGWVGLVVLVISNFARGCSKQLNICQMRADGLALRAKRATQVSLTFE